MSGDYTWGDEKEWKDEVGYHTWGNGEKREASDICGYYTWENEKELTSSTSGGITQGNECKVKASDMGRGVTYVEWGERTCKWLGSTW